MIFKIRLYNSIKLPGTCLGGTCSGTFRVLVPVPELSWEILWVPGSGSEFRSWKWRGSGFFRLKKSSPNFCENQRVLPLSFFLKMLKIFLKFFSKGYCLCSYFEIFFWKLGSDRNVPVPELVWEILWVPGSGSEFRSEEFRGSGFWVPSSDLEQKFR